MKIDLTKLDIALARECKTISDLRGGVSPQTLARVKRGEEVKPRTIGKIARALGVDVTEIMEGVSA